MSNLEQAFEQYTKFVLTLASQSGKPSQLDQGIIGIATEGGELLDALKKQLFQERPIDRYNIVEECGDVLFYLVELMDAVDTSLPFVMIINTLKLKKRYPAGKFDREMSILRSYTEEKIATKQGEINEK